MWFAFRCMLAKALVQSCYGCYTKAIDSMLYAARDTFRMVIDFEKLNCRFGIFLASMSDLLGIRGGVGSDFSLPSLVLSDIWKDGRMGITGGMLESD